MIRISPRWTVLILLCAVFTGLASAKTNTTTTLASSLNPSTYGSSVKFTATVTPSAATGTVTFKDGTTTLGTGTLSSGKATFTTSTLTAGAHSITASYAGNTTYNASTSSALSQTVSKASSTTTVASSANPSTYGSSVKFTATVTPSAATGTVTFLDGTTTLGTGTISSGKATYTTTTLTAGSHSITASYGGDSNHNSSTSSILTQTVNKANSTVTLASSANPSTFGSSVTLTATITPSSATGTVTFLDGTTTLGTSTISGGTAVYSTSTLALGSHSITASYGGDSNCNSKTSSKLTQVVEQASAVALSSSTNPAPPSAPVTFTAAVTPSAATGTVTFMSGSATLGTGTVSGGTATFTTSSLAIGSYSITAVYSGDGNYVGSTSSVLTQKVLALTSITLAPLTVSLPIGATQQFIATGTFSDTSTGNITLSATWSSSATNVATISAAGIASGVAEGPATIQAAVGTVNASATITGTPSSFRLTGSLVTARIFHTETVLQNGQVLIAGGAGNDGFNILGECELYNPTTGEFSTTGSLRVPRFNHTATLLSNGMVLITGGQMPEGAGSTAQTPTAELYNPATGTFTLTGSLLDATLGSFTATLLNSGMVLIAGGGDENGFVATAELYNPTTGTFGYTGNLNEPRGGHTATLLNDGTVLIAGGDSATNGVFSDVAVAELYNPTTGLFSNTSSLNTPRAGHTATLLNTGNVLIAGGNAGNSILASTELYNPATKAFTTTGNMSSPRESSSFTATLLPNGNVLLLGGINNNLVLGTGDLYNPTTGTFSLAGSLNDARDSQTAALLNNGTVLIAGGSDQNGYDISSAELYDSAGVPPAPFSLQITPAAVNIAVGGTQTFTAVDNLGIPRTDATWTVSNTSLASLASNANGTAILTGLAAGVVTLTATAEGVTAQEQVTILTTSAFVPGTVTWSAPAVPGFSVQQLIQAVPSINGPDLYSTQISSDGTKSIIQALKADGEQLWQAQVPPLLNNAVPDALGGLVVTSCVSGSPMTITDLDATGKPLWVQAAAGVDNGTGFTYICYPAPIAVRGDGTVIITEPTNAGLPSMTGISPNGGGVGGGFQFTPSTVTNNGNTIPVNCCVGPPMVNTDGTVYTEYEVRNTNNGVITSDTLYLYISTTGSIVLSTTTQNEALLPGPIISDGQGGVLATWTVSPAQGPVLQFPYQAADVTNGVVGTPYNLPFSPPSVTPFVSPTLVLGDNSTVLATNGTDTVNGPLVASMALASGAVNWTYRGGTQSTLSIIASTAGGGVAINDSKLGVTLLNPSGNSSQISGTSGSTAQTSLLGNWYLQNAQGFSQLVQSPLPLAATYWDFPNGSQFANGSAVDQVQANQTQGPAHQLPPSGVTLNTNYNSIEILTTKSPSYIFQTYLQTFEGIWPGNNDVATVPNTTNITGTGQNLQFTLESIFASKPMLWLQLGQGPFSVQTERFDTTANTISAVTLQGHPLAGWRYWRVYSVGTNDLVIETGAADVSALENGDQSPDAYIDLPYYLFRGSQTKIWQEDLQFILNDLRANKNGNGDPNATEGSNPSYNNVNGEWNPTSPSLPDILNNVCQQPTCN